MLRRFPCNQTDGRDFVVGDIHGEFTLMECLLSALAFDPLKDRVFALGDLIDRGPENSRAAEFLSAPWFYSVRGNHEAMLLDSVAERAQTACFGPKTDYWHLHGGSWFEEISPSEQTHIADYCARMPHVIEVELADGRLAGLVHADSFPDWSKTRARAESDTAPKSCQHLLWSGARAKQARLGGQGATVDHIDLVYYGHIPMSAPLRCGNGFWLDTGAGHPGGKLSLALLGDNHGVWMMGNGELLLSQGYTDNRADRHAA